MKKKLSALLAAVLLTGAGIAGYLRFTAERASIVRAEDGIYVTAKTTRALQKAFLDLNYDIAASLDGEAPVPRIFTTRIPEDFNREKFDAVRPAILTEILFPLILKANREVEDERDSLLPLIKKFTEQDGSADEKDLERLREYAKKYDISFDAEKPHEAAAELANRADSVLPAVLLAMAAQDSGFATSRYAREYNNVFNHRNWDGRGAEPDEHRKPGETYLIAVYPTLYDGLLERILYINREKSFEGFRYSRQSYRRTGAVLRSTVAAADFVNVPDRSLLYSDFLNTLLRQYEWHRLDWAKLSPK